jgi:hypothetical protein
VRSTQGRCHVCQLRYVWPLKKGLLRGAHCERCGSELRQTNHLCRNRTVFLPEGPIYSEEAVKDIRRKAGIFR